MGALLHFPPCFSFNKQPKLRWGEPTFLLREIADGCSTLPSRKAASFQFTVSSRRSDGNRRGNPSQKNPASERKNEGQNKKPSENKITSSSNQEEIIALFNRIQSSISKKEPTSSKEINPKPSEKKPSADSVLDLLHQFRKGIPDTMTEKARENKLKWRRAVAKEQKILNKETAVDFRLFRPPSNFVKRSPIPSPSVPRGKILEMKKEPKEDAAAIEKLKLPELKQIAKSRGIKGYSRLKKSELVKLLSS